MTTPNSRHPDVTWHFPTTPLGVPAQRVIYRQAAAGNRMTTPDSLGLSPLPHIRILGVQTQRVTVNTERDDRMPTTIIGVRTFTSRTVAPWEFNLKRVPKRTEESNLSRRTLFGPRL